MTALAPLRVQNYVVTLPPLHEGRNGSGGQVAIENEDTPYKIILCGRRWGKTTYGVWKCVKSVIERGGLYWWVAPTYGTAEPGWIMLKKLVNQLKDAGIPGIELRESDRRAIFPKGEIWVKSADNPDGLRGHGLSGVVLDEPAQIKSEAWYEALQPALLDHKGWAIFIGTPKGKNWLWELWRMAGTDPEWSRYRRFSVDNPYVDPAWVESKRLTISDESFRQEYEADFGASQYLVFPDFSVDLHPWTGEIPRLIQYNGGLDFGGTSIGHHKSAGCWTGRTEADELIICGAWEEGGTDVGRRQVEWMGEQDELVRLMARVFETGHKGIHWRADKTQMWGIQLVRDLGFNIVPSKGGPESVENGIELIHRRLQSRVGKLGGQPRPRLFYLPTCAKIVEDHFGRYRYEEPDPEKQMRRVPLKILDDWMDACRYNIEDVDYSTIGDPNEVYANQFRGLTEPALPKRFSERMKQRKLELNHRAEQVRAEQEWKNSMGDDYYASR